MSINSPRPDLITFGCGMCQTPSCLICFPFERKKMFSSMLDTVDMDELEAAALIIDRETDAIVDAGIETARRFNQINNIEAPRLEDTVAPRVANEIKKMFKADVIDDHLRVLDFAGVIDGGGVKDSMKNTDSKPRMALVPRALIIGCARVLTYGAIKYAPNNWRRGMRWGEPADALLRHFFAWLEGEDNDPESGESHLSHMAANLAFLMHMASDPAYAELDDRPRLK